MINYHSGISPLYNGASSAMFAFANGHVHLCGGTLMRMSTVVDGGEILAHYLPEVEADDDPASLFMKIVRGAAMVGSSFVEALGARGTFTSVPQPPPLFYYTNEAWTVYQTQQVRLHLRRGTAARYVRPERTIPYWSGSPVESRESMLQTIEELLGLR
jgi:methionyl-tRNA formyltransferase